jgi:hypothetical protein
VRRDRDRGDLGRGKGGGSKSNATIFKAMIFVLEFFYM